MATLGIVADDVTGATTVGALIAREGEPQALPLMAKSAVADALIDHIDRSFRPAAH